MAAYSDRTSIQPANEPLTLVEAKRQLHVDSDDTNHDGLLRQLIRAARTEIEDGTGRVLCPQTRQLRLDGFPRGGFPLRLPRSPLIAVSSIQYTDSAGDAQTWAAADYVIGSFDEPPEIRPAYGLAYPVARDIPDAVSVTYVAGYGLTCAADADADTLAPTGRTFRNGDLVQLSNYGGALPAGLSHDTTYFVVGATSSTIQLALTSGGAAIDITGAGTGTHLIDDVPELAKHAMRMMIGHWFAHREAASEMRSGEVPMGVQRMIDRLSVGDDFHNYAR